MDILSLLSCPHCSAELRSSRATLACRKCRRRYPVIGGIPVLDPKAGKSFSPRVPPLLIRIQDASDRISNLSAAFKPVLRLLCDAGGSLWDFDDALQKTLLRLARELASDGTLLEACRDRWVRNLASLYEQHERGISRARPPGAPSFRDELLSRHAKTRGRILYVGCGTGSECLSLARAGYDVVGIDYSLRGLQIMRKAAEAAGARVSAVCMDATNMGFAPGTFDGWILELYGFIPSSTHVARMMRSLAAALAPGGVGLVSAGRREYPSHWYRMAEGRYPGKMREWLIRQSRLDRIFSREEKSEERLVNGLYNRSSSIASLRAELSREFAVVSCVPDRDPRYVLAVVRGKGSGYRPAPVPVEQKRKPSRRRSGEIEQRLVRIERICGAFRRHEQRLAAFFAGHDRFPSLRDLRRICPRAEAVAGDIRQAIVP